MAATQGEAEETGGASEQRLNSRLRNALCDAFEDEEDDGDAGVTTMPAAPPLDAHGPDLSKALRGLRRRLTEYLIIFASNLRKGGRWRSGVPHQVGCIRSWSGASNSVSGSLAIASSSRRRAGGTRRRGRTSTSYQVRNTQGRNSYYVTLQHMKNHLWREVWPAMLQGSEATQYWRGEVKLGRQQ